MSEPTWLQRLEWLAVKFSYLGMTGDMASMALDELEGLYRFLSHLDGETL